MRSCLRVVSAALLIAAAVMSAPLVAQAVPASACPGVIQVIGVRGSGETNADYHGYGHTVWDVVQKYKSYVPAQLTVKSMYVDYQAVGVGYDSVAYGLVYHQSVAQGIAVLNTKLIALSRQTCVQTGYTRILLVGYSQGAQVVADEMAAMPATMGVPIFGAILISDPRFNGSDPKVSVTQVNTNTSAVNFGSYAKNLNGVARFLDPWKPARDWTSLPWTFSVCAANDPVCNFTPTNAASCLVASKCAHLHYFDHAFQGALWTQWAAQRAWWMTTGGCGIGATATVGTGPPLDPVVAPRGC